MSSDGRGDSVSSLNPASTLDGTEIIPMTQGTRTLRGLLSSISTYVVQVAKSFTQSGTGAVATTVQAKNRRKLDVFDFIPTALHSAIEAGTNTTDLSAYIQLAFDEMADSKRALDLGAYELDIENTLTLELLSNLEMFGQGGNGGTNLACRFRWNGANGGTVISLDRVRDSSFSRFAIVPGAGTIGVALDIDGTAPLTVVPTACIFRELSLIGAMTTCIRIANTSASNNEFHRFYDVTMSGTGTNGYLIGHSQSKAHKIYNGSITGKEKGVHVLAGSFTSYSLNFNDNDVDIYLDQPADPILINNPTGENSRRFIDDSGAASTAVAVTVCGGRMASNDVDADGKYIRFHRPGPLNLIGVDFATGVNRPTVKFECSGSLDGTMVNAIGCVFPNGTPFHRAITSDRNTVRQMGNIYVDVGGVARPLPSSGLETCVADGANSMIGPNVRLFDDFLGDVMADQWNASVGSDPQCVAAAVNPGQSGGEIRMTTGDDATGDMATNGTQLDSGLNWKADRKQLVIETRIRMSAITDVAVYFGFTDQVAALEMPFTLGALDALTSNATDAVGVLFDTAAATDNWWLVGVKADVDATAQNSAAPPIANRWETWRIEVIDDSGVYFYRNGSLVGSKMTAAITESVLLTPVIAAFSRGAASRNIDVDYINVQSSR